MKQSTPFLPFFSIFFFQVSWIYFFFRRLFWQPSLSGGVTEANQSLGGCICYRPSVESSYLLGSFFFCTRFVNKYIGQFTFLRGWHRLATNRTLGERSEPFLAAKRPTEFYFSSRSRFVIIQLSYAETMPRIYEKTCSVWKKGGSLAYSSYPGWINFSYISKKTWLTVVFWETKSWLGYIDKVYLFEVS